MALEPGKQRNCVQWTQHGSLRALAVLRPPRWVCGFQPMTLVTHVNSERSLPQISDVGGLALGRAAKAAIVLHRLNISLNNTTDATLLALADVLKFNSGARLVCWWAGWRRRAPTHPPGSHPLWCGR